MLKGVNNDLQVTVFSKEQPFIWINHIADYVNLLKSYFGCKLPRMTKVSWMCSFLKVFSQLRFRPGKCDFLF